MQPDLHEIFEPSECRRASHEFIKISVELGGGHCILLGLVLILGTDYRCLLSVHCGLLELFKEVRLEDGVDSEVPHFQLDCVASIKALFDPLRVLSLILEVTSKVLIFMAAEIWKTGV